MADWYGDIAREYMSGTSADDSTSLGSYFSLGDGSEVTSVQNPKPNYYGSDDMLLDLFQFDRDDRDTQDILDFLAGAKENDYQPTFGDMVGGVLGGLLGGSGGSGGGTDIASLLGPLALTSFLNCLLYTSPSPRDS